MKNETILELTNEDIAIIGEDKLFKELQLQFDQSGYIYNEGCKIFNPELAYILTNTRIKYTNQKNKINVFDGTDFMPYYLGGYRAGLFRFERNFEVNVETLYGKNALSYVESLHHKVYHSDAAGSDEGWSFWITAKNPITRDNIHLNGLYAGLLSKVYDLQENHPGLFRDFDKCKHDKNKIPIGNKDGVKEKVKKEPSDITKEKYRMYMTDYNELMKKPEMTIQQAEEIVQKKYRFGYRTFERARMWGE